MIMVNKDEVKCALVSRKEFHGEFPIIVQCMQWCMCSNKEISWHFNNYSYSNKEELSYVMIVARGPSLRDFKDVKEICVS